MENINSKPDCRASVWSRRWRLVEAPVAILIAGSRVILGTPSALWRDMVFVLSAYWIYSALVEQPRRRALALTVVMAYLVAVYVVRQFPRTLEVLGAAG